MERLIYITLCALAMVSCGSHKNVSTAVVDKNVEVYQRALQRSRDKFYALDSANSIMQDLGWARRIVKEAKIQENTIPAVYRSINDDGFTIELPCWEDNTDKYWYANVIIEHKRLDSALVKAKIQGVEEIVRGVSCRIQGHSDNDCNLYIDSVEYDDHTYYMMNATFSCVCVLEQRKKYIVNASIRVPKKEVQLINQREILNTEKAETPSK